MSRSSEPLVTSAAAARRFLLRTLLFDALQPDVGGVLRHLGFVQIDPINVCGRMHDLILRNRVAGYAEGGLMRNLHGEAGPLEPATRTAFEHHLPGSNILVAFPLDAWPHLRDAMRQRARSRGSWSGKLTPRERELAAVILAEIGRCGPLSSDHIDDDRRSRRIWGTGTLAKSTLQKLFFHGRVLISHREKHRRLYDLPERVLPSLALGGPELSAVETARWLALLKVRQRRLVTLKRTEVPLLEGLVQPVRVEGAPLLYCLAADAPLLRDALDLPAPPAAPRLLAPLDPLIYDRALASSLWGFDYTWEVYVPAAKRVRGYYALPVLAGAELVGHVDPKAERAQGRLAVVSRRVRRGHRIAPALDELARFLGLRR